MDFESLYKKYAPAVRRFALFLCGDRALADDITSDTFLRVWLTRGRIRELTVQSYLFAVARNAYRDLQRRDWRRAELDESDANQGASVQEHLEHREELAVVLAGLQELPEIDRAALLMRSLDEMPYEEIAAALDVTVATARVKVHRARARLIAVRNPIREKLTEERR
jgi:RNA polymerase sigma-70 factor, ECF subfamily